APHRQRQALPRRTRASGLCYFVQAWTLSLFGRRSISVWDEAQPDHKNREQAGERRKDGAKPYGDLQCELQPAGVYVVFNDDLKAKYAMPENAQAQHDKRERVHRLRN